MSKKTTRCFYVAMMTLLIALPATAGVLDKGDKELTLDGSLSIAQGSRLFDLGVSVGYMLSRTHEAGVILRYFHESYDSVNFNVGTIGGFYNYNFRASGGNLVPFAGGGVAFGFGQGGTAGTPIFGDPSVFAGAGVKYFLNEGAEIRVEYVFQRYFGEADLGANGLQIGIALTF